MKIFVESLKRLYEARRIDKVEVERQRNNKKITNDEYAYILRSDGKSSKDDLNT